VKVASVKRKIKEKDVYGLKCFPAAVKDFCKPCVNEKAAMPPMPSGSGGRVTKCLQLVHSDFGDPISEPSRRGAL